MYNKNIHKNEAPCVSRFFPLQNSPINRPALSLYSKVLRNTPVNFKNDLYLVIVNRALCECLIVVVNKQRFRTNDLQCCSSKQVHTMLYNDTV